MLPLGSSHDTPQLSNVEPVFPPQDVVPEEHRNSTETFRGLLKWLPKMKRNKDPAVDEPDRFSRRSHRSHPQTHSQSPTQVNAGPPRMAEGRREVVSVPEIL